MKSPNKSSTTLIRKIGNVILVIVLVIFGVYLTYTAERAMDYFNIGADNS